jgi:hypothetical protein
LGGNAPGSLLSYNITERSKKGGDEKIEMNATTFNISGPRHR